VFVVAMLAAVATAPAQGPSEGQMAFERLKSLEGEWEGTHGEGQKAWSSFRVVSNGSMLLETHKSATEDYSMVTTYYVDNGRLMMTHFCGAGNQPRMVAEEISPDGKRMAFRLQDVTNLTSSAAGHMRALEIGLVDADHYTEQWTWREKGKDEPAEVFKLRRKR
jgi:hypothetical protein